MILLIDNYDSFVYNLARYVSELNEEVCVIRHDAITLLEIEKLKPSHIMISPGPCTPAEAGISKEVVRHFAKNIPILGVCLGHQVIAEVFGAKVVKAKNPMHGKSSLITHAGEDLFKGLNNPLKVGRYHSLIVEDLPKELNATAFSSEGEIMALSHKHFKVLGVQFHPESILTEQGYDLLKNFIRI